MVFGSRAKRIRTHWLFVRYKLYSDLRLQWYELQSGYYIIRKN